MNTVSGLPHFFDEFSGGRAVGAGETPINHRDVDTLAPPIGEIAFGDLLHTRSNGENNGGSSTGETDAEKLERLRREWERIERERNQGKK